jgi:hypothetical protein
MVQLHCQPAFKRSHLGMPQLIPLQGFGKQVLGDMFEPGSCAAASCCARRLCMHVCMYACMHVAGTMTFDLKPMHFIHQNSNNFICNAL